MTEKTRPNWPSNFLFCMTSSTDGWNASMADDCEVFKNCLTTNNHINHINGAIVLLRYGIHLQPWAYTTTGILMTPTEELLVGAKVWRARLDNVSWDRVLCCHLQEKLRSSINNCRTFHTWNNPSHTSVSRVNGTLLVTDFLGFCLMKLWFW